MASKRFWKGFTAGLAAGAGTGFGCWLLSRAWRNRQHARVVRLERSVQIGRPVEEVFQAWSDFSRLPSFLRAVKDVQVHGDRSSWRMRLNGRTVEWEAEITQRVPNQALGWKSITGPKHTGRVNFSPLGHDTELHVVMNYSPPLGLFGRRLTEEIGLLESRLEQALRDFKAALEGKGQPEKRAPEKAVPTGVPANQEAQVTGTYGPEADLAGRTQTTRFGGVPDPVEHTRPPETES